jgi:hypothetical protein
MFSTRFASLLTGCAGPIFARGVAVGDEAAIATLVANLPTGVPDMALDISSEGRWKYRFTDVTYFSGILLRQARAAAWTSPRALFIGSSTTSHANTPLVINVALGRVNKPSDMELDVD